MLLRTVLKLVMTVPEHSFRFCTLLSLLFMGYVDAVTTFALSYGGGGGGDTGGWRDKDDDEDWKRYIQRCAREAQSMARKPAKVQNHTQSQAQAPSRSSYKRKGR